MQGRDLHEELIKEFLRRVKLIYEGHSGSIPWENISELKESDLVSPEELFSEEESIPYLDGSTVVIKLNGGLGTSMGLNQAKSLIPAKEGLSFIQIIKKQILAFRKKHGVPIPLIFMNSFYTQEDTLAEDGIASINMGIRGDLPADFLQNMIPRLDAESLLPAGDGSSPSDWCPPGHGDIFLAMKISGLLEHLLSAGYRTAFISNSDNLGAVLDPVILAYFKQNELDFLSEVTPKTSSDIKGGVLYRSQDRNRIELLECAQVEKKHLPDFENTTRFSSFNINNLWINLESLRDMLERGFELPIIRNPKTIKGKHVLQLESAMGAAIGLFERSRVIPVSRDRFIPVKNCSDLLACRSDAFLLDKDSYSLKRNRGCKEEPLHVRLDKNYASLHEFEHFFPLIPSLCEADSLEIHGPVLFDKKVRITGKVSIINENDETTPISHISRESFKDEELHLG